MKVYNLFVLEATFTVQMIIFLEYTGANFTFGFISSEQLC